MTEILKPIENIVIYVTIDLYYVAFMFYVYCVLLPVFIEFIYSWFYMLKTFMFTIVDLFDS